MDENGAKDGLVEHLSRMMPSVYADAVVAAELGYSCGDTYTSLTGAFDRGGEHQGAGAVQLAALCAQLWRAGYRVWDTGQHMDYKQKMFHVSGHTQEEWLVCNLFHAGMECASPFPSPLPPVTRCFPAGVKLSKGNSRHEAGCNKNKTEDTAANGAVADAVSAWLREHYASEVLVSHQGEARRETSSSMNDWCPPAAAVAACGLRSPQDVDAASFGSIRAAAAQNESKDQEDPASQKSRLEHLAALSRATPAPLPVRFILDSFYGKTV